MAALLLLLLLALVLALTLQLLQLPMTLMTVLGDRAKGLLVLGQNSM